ncbi:nuclear transport factor 2 family protein [Janthinobacterium fluminis]|uniref:Nuclear transport factor 2 family protein n=1 Tax=Janthinobacterium fluminis TaxID=2987524 RepID=A0ABT5K4P7_9BURK|nr:nuclear transport factor 2 family protein [Janthinobacterium fluminis]MDC8759976.1 nuclear transport factor 2 family protein [Janthinobacterium fluminis]
MELNSREVIEAYWLHANARNWPAFATLLAADIVYELPQTRQRIRGRDACAAFNASHLDQWQIELLRLLVDGARAVSEVALTRDGETATGIAFFDIAGGQISRVVEHWPLPRAAPARPAAGVEHD